MDDLTDFDDEAQDGQDGLEGRLFLRIFSLKAANKALYKEWSCCCKRQ